MTNHVHLLVKTDEQTLGAGMQDLHGRYAQMFNHRHDRRGHLFQSRYGSTRIEDDAQMNAVTRYIARNPVEAGLCRNPEDWPWTDYRNAVAAMKGSDPGSDPLPGWAMRLRRPSRGLRPFGVEHPALERVADQLGALGEVKLLLDVGAVGLDGPHADEELLGDLAVGVAEGDEAQDLELAIGEVVRAASAGSAARRAPEIGLEVCPALRRPGGPP